jgi:hypothetical protein
VKSYFIFLKIALCFELFVNLFIFRNIKQNFNKITRYSIYVFFFLQPCNNIIKIVFVWLLKKIYILFVSFFLDYFEKQSNWCIQPNTPVKIKNWVYKLLINDCYTTPITLFQTNH